ncbi:MAG: hypothetical protein QXH80_02830, partial [Candidatus Nanoarchaeia archaeon]
GGQCIDIEPFVHKLVSEASATTPGQARAIADAILAEAIARDDGRPADDISVLVVAVLPAQPDMDDVRRMSVRFPIRIKGAD